MNIQIQEEGARLYIAGNSFPIKDSIKAAGGHWDADRKQWWVGKVKKETIEKAIEKASAAPEVGPESKVKGKVEYKGKKYYVLATAKDGQSYKVCTLDASLVFWCKVENGAKLVKTYGREVGFRGYSSYARARQNDIEYPTLKSIAEFIKDAPDRQVREANAPTKVCWECGCAFTKRHASEHGGDWSDSYCGC